MTQQTSARKSSVLLAAEQGVGMMPAELTSCASMSKAKRLGHLCDAVNSKTNPLHLMCQGKDVVIPKDHSHLV